MINLRGSLPWHWQELITNQFQGLVTLRTKCNVMREIILDQTRIWLFESLQFRCSYMSCIWKLWTGLTITTPPPHYIIFCPFTYQTGFIFPWLSLNWLNQEIWIYFILQRNNLTLTFSMSNYTIPRLYSGFILYIYICIYIHLHHNSFQLYMYSWGIFITLKHW